MNQLAAILFAVFAFSPAVPGVDQALADNFERPSTTATVKTYLEGTWLDGVPADKGDCRSNWYGGATEIEFEFRRSGGRLMIFEPYDLFQQIQVPKIEVSGDTVSLFAQNREGVLAFFRRLRIVGDDELEVAAVHPIFRSMRKHLPTT